MESVNFFSLKITSPYCVYGMQRYMSGFCSDILHPLQEAGKLPLTLVAIGEDSEKKNF